MKRNICFITGSRAEYGVMYHTLKHIEKSKNLELQLVVAGMHLSKEFGNTINEILEDGFSIAERVDMLVASDSPAAIAKSIGLGIISFADCLSRLDPDIVLVTADRYEIFAAAAAAMALNLPIAHVSGGELTAGAIDEQIRHAITKMSHIHFTAIERNAERVRQMGEEPWRVHVVGGPWVDNIINLRRTSRDELEKRLRIKLSKPTILVTYHPVTLQLDKINLCVRNLFDALKQVDAEIIFTYPNADAGGRVIIAAIEKFVGEHPESSVFKSLGRNLYLNLLAHIDLVVGNSSSGVVETQSFKLPVVNIGDRQKGRLITENIICVAEDKDKILKGIEKGLDKKFRSSIADMEDPYDKAGAAEHITRILSTVDLGPRLLRKEFISA